MRVSLAGSPVAVGFASLVSRVAVGFASLVPRVAAGFASLVTRVAAGFASLVSRVAAGFASLVPRVAAGFASLVPRVAVGLGPDGRWTRPLSTTAPGERPLLPRPMRRRRASRLPRARSQSSRAAVWSALSNRPPSRSM